MARYRLDEGPVPLHRQVYLDLRAALAAGEWKPCERLPTERRLTELYGCSLITVRRALDELAREGRLERARGRGTFATRAPGEPAAAAAVRSVVSVRPASGDTPALVLAVDVGNSKTDVALVSAGGGILGAVRGPTASHQQVGVEAGMATLVGLVERTLAQAGLDAEARPAAQIVAYCAAGADTPGDVRLLSGGLRETGLAAEDLIRNDCHAGLRAGTSRGWGVCVVCGSGMNCLGVAPDGRAARFDALGAISGDWGGGGAVGEAGLAAAVRAQDGRGPATILRRTVPAHFGLGYPRTLTAALYRGVVAEDRLREVAPLVFGAAAAGDAVARDIVDRLADEVVAWAAAAIRRLRLGRLDPDVVLAGGIFRAEDAAFYRRIETGIAAVAPSARVTRLQVPPVVGSALLGLDRLLGGTAPAEVESRLRGSLTDERLARGWARS